MVMLVRALASCLHRFQGFTLCNTGGIQTTRTNELSEEKWVKSSYPEDSHHRPIGRKHYRLVTTGAGFRLSTFKGTRELLSATFDALIGKASIHRLSPLLSALHLSYDGCTLKGPDSAPGSQLWQHYTL